MARSIQKQWLVFVGLLASAVVITTIGIAALVARHHMYGIAEQEARTRAQTFAYRAGFAALVGREDASTVATLLAEIMQSRTTIAARLLASGQDLGKIERAAGALDSCEFITPRGAESTATVVRDTWCLAAPISVGEGEIESRRVVGTLQIVASRRDVAAGVERMVLWFCVPAFIILGLAWLAAWRGANHITEALVALAETMQGFGPGARAPRAENVGPEEVRTIAAVYNNLLEAIARHEKGLEDQVESRTRELYAALDRIRQAERYKSTFMAAISHEMKTPLHLIDAHARDVLAELEMLQGSADARAQVDVILQESDKLAARLGQVLELARSESTDYERKHSTFDLADLANEARRKAEPIARRNANILSVTACRSCIHTDRDAVEQIVSNLLTNACKFTAKGRISLMIEDDARELRIVVTDTGCGMAEDVVEKMFQEFWQADAGEGRKVGGFGLGMAIVHRSVLALEGEIQVDSKLGVGTEIFVKIPLRAQPESQECEIAT